MPKTFQDARRHMYNLYTPAENNKNMDWYHFVPQNYLNSGTDS